MTTDQIAQFLDRKLVDKQLVRISFKTRSAVTGVFIKAPDYDELRSKNLWRVVWQSNIDNYNKSKDVNLARIFNGTEITKLAAAS